jgi:hypothetical protein
MHTATNYYLFNLAVADLILLFVGLPHESADDRLIVDFRIANAIKVYNTLMNVIGNKKKINS